MISGVQSNMDPECVRVLKPGGVLVVGSFHNIYQLGFILQSFSPQLRIITASSGSLARQHHCECSPKHEHLIWAAKQGGERKWKFKIISDQA